ncbi:MAG: hypothetical protein PHN72_05800 [Bacilli bacterium]|nr:hypothetical protein [Bacilli bacterium]
MKENIIEKLSDYEHNRWARWQKHLFSKSIKNYDGSITIPKEYVDRWTRQINTNYCDLSNNEKESDRREAKIILEIVDGENHNVNKT